jgi:small subunit ribosomal protein S1
MCTERNGDADRVGGRFVRIAREIDVSEETSNPETEAGDAGIPPTHENFAELLDGAYGTETNLEGTVVPGTVIAIENDVALIDVGLKAEGRVPLREFAAPGNTADLKIGDTVEVYLERMESKTGESVLSRERARREEAWTKLQQAFNESERVEGVIFGRVKGGFTVDLSGAVAFLPGSQVDVRPVRDIGPLMGSKEPFQILKMDRRRGNIVVSRRAVLEEARAEARAEVVANLAEGQIHDGVVKNITDYGAFVDLGGIDGLLHVTDMSWRRIGHPSEVLSIGQTLKVQVIRVNVETQRISLGIKQLEADPWDGVDAKYPVGTKFTGRVTNITDYGAFVELEAGVEGLVHISEMSWTKKNVHPGKIISTSQQVEVMVLDVDPVKRRISLGLKQCMDNPWESFLDKFPPGSIIEGKIKSITEFGLFVGLDEEVDGMVHLSDLSWERPGDEAITAYTKGDTVKAKVLDVSVDRERISLGIKDLTGDPLAASDIKRGARVTCTVTAVRDGGIEVALSNGASGFIRRSDLGRDRSEQRTDRFAVGERVDARIGNIDRDTRRVTLSIKALEISDEKQAMEQFGSSDSGASLGDILGAAISRSEAAREASEDDAQTGDAAADQDPPTPEAADGAPQAPTEDGTDAPEQAPAEGGEPEPEVEASASADAPAAPEAETTEETAPEPDESKS